MEFEQLSGQKLLVAFHGKDRLSPEIIQSFKCYSPGGVSLFRSLNVGTPAQLKELNESLQRLAHSLGLPPLLIAIDQEGGQLMAVGDGTPLPGNMALGAARSTELARQAGEVLGRELAALGINVNYAPCADVNSNPRNPVVGTRSFGEDPFLVGELSAAVIEGVQSQGVAATVKHFPGHGDTASDSHHGRALVTHSLEHLRNVDLPPFTAALRTGVKMVMTAHLGIPAIDGPDAPPATLSSNIINGLLRREMGFDGVVVTDAMDMRAIRQGELLGEDVVRAAQAGADLLLITSDPLDHARAYEALQQAASSGVLRPNDLRDSCMRIARLKTWLAAQPSAPDLSVIQSSSHLRVANEIARRSITLVQDRHGYLPIHLSPDQKILVVVPQPQDLTPADTSSYITPKLATSLRAYHPRVDEVFIPFAPSDQDRTALLQRMKAYDMIVIGTINAFTQMEQAELVRAAASLQIPLIVVALRLPYDLAAFPMVSTYLCTYSILEPSMRALAGALFGQAPMTGRLPVTIPGIESIAGA